MGKATACPSLERELVRSRCLNVAVNPSLYMVIGIGVGQHLIFLFFITGVIECL